MNATQANAPLAPRVASLFRRHAIAAAALADARADVSATAWVFDHPDDRRAYRDAVKRAARLCDKIDLAIVASGFEGVGPDGSEWIAG